MRGAAWSAPVIVAAVSTPAWAASCLPPTTLFNTSAQGRLISGTIGGVTLDTIAAVNGATAVVNASTPSPVQQSNPLSISALGAININLGGVTRALSSVLTIPTGVPTGVINQFARAVSDGTSTGASGAVANNGTIQLDSSGGVPELASLDLRTILENVTGSPQLTALLSNAAALNLQVGAAAGRSFIDTRCLTGGAPDIITREYLLAYLRLAVQSPLVGQLLSSLGSITINPTALLDALRAIPVLGPIISALATATATVTVDTSPLTNAAIPSSGNNPVTINFGAGSVVVDLAALLGGAYTGEISPWLNNRAPNSRLFIDAPLPVNALPTIISTLANGLVDALASTITLNIRVAVVGLEVVRVQGTLRQLLDGTPGVLTIAGVPVTPTIIANVTNAINGLIVGAVTTALSGVNGLLANLFSVLQNVLVLTINAQTSSGGVYDASALRVGVLNAVSLLDLRIARGIGGPNVSRPA